MEIISKYFPDLTEQQRQQYANLWPLYRFWNQRINLISKSDIGFLDERHVLHSLAIARFLKFEPGTHVLDLGTGGGFPGIPLAIMFPDVSFHLVDLIRKKTNVVHTIARDLGLQNLIVEQTDVQALAHQYDFVVCRAVTNFKTLVSWVRPLIHSRSGNDLPNGFITLKGGDLQSELDAVEDVAYAIGLAEYYEEEFFADKQLVYVAL